MGEVGSGIEIGGGLGELEEKDKRGRAGECRGVFEGSDGKIEGVGMEVEREREVEVG